MMIGVLTSLRLQNLVTKNIDNNKEAPSDPGVIFSRFFDEILSVALKSKPWYRPVKSIIRNMLTEQNKNVRETDCFQL